MIERGPCWLPGFASVRRRAPARARLAALLGLSIPLAPPLVPVRLPGRTRPCIHGRCWLDWLFSPFGGEQARRRLGLPVGWDRRLQGVPGAPPPLRARRPPPP